jgi:hypothetical protein
MRVYFFQLNKRRGKNIGKKRQAKENKAKMRPRKQHSR